MTTLEMKGIAHELAFWMRFVKEERFIKGWVPKNVTTPELHPRARQIIRECLMDKNEKADKVLDVGSGVVSILNGFIKEDELFSVDPLASLYELIFDYKKYKLTAPATLPAENLPWPNTFDLVHCSNALDHTQDPGAAIRSMLGVLKPGGHLVVQGFSNEGAHENYSGFHQWNITVDVFGDLIIKDKDDKVKDAFNSPGQAFEVLPLDTPDRYWYIWTYKKI